MPILTVNLAYDEPGAGVSPDPGQTLYVQALSDVTEVDGGVTYIVDPAKIALPLVDGVGSVDLEVGYYWVHRWGDSKLVHLVADARLDELASLDPASLDPGANPEPAWWEALELRPILERKTQAEYDALTPAEQADPLKLYVIPAIP